jgi:hypothetical protein
MTSTSKRSVALPAVAVTVARPGARALITPAGVSDTTAGAELCHVTRSGRRYPDDE